MNSQTMTSRSGKRLRAVLGAVALGLASAGGVAAVAPTSAAADPCGFYKTHSPAISYYNHCGSKSAAVKLTVEAGFDQFVCLPPGTTDLTRLGDVMHIYITYAKSDGSSCN